MLSNIEERRVAQSQYWCEISSDSFIVIIIVITRTETVAEDDEQYGHQNENSCRQSNAHDEGNV